MEAASRRKKDFESEHSGVFAAPGLPLAHCQLRNPGSGAMIAPGLAGSDK